MVPAECLKAQPGDIILDLCAAPGGKSTQIAAAMKGEGILICNEIHPARAKILSENIERMGIKNALVLNETPEQLAEHFPVCFDKIMVDAPCSGEGMFRKNEEAGNEWSLDNVKLCADRQDGILDCAYEMLRPGGRMVYSTCTFAPEEDEGSVHRFLERHPDCQIAEGIDSEGFIHDKEGCIRLFPHKIEGEGHFVCLVKKQGDRDNRANYGDYPVKRAKLPDSVTEFLSHTTHEFHPERFEISGDKLYYIPESFPTVRGLRILRCGLYVGEIKKNRFEPSQSLAMALTKKEFDNCLDLPADDAKVIKYLKGETIDFDDASVKNGYVLVCVDGYPLGFGKANQGVLKNKYLPGWRLMS